MLTQLAWGNKTGEPFADAVVTLCKSFNWYEQAPTDLMSCMAFESGETFSPSVKNMAGSGAVGLIQFMPATAIGLGTTTENLALLSAIDQLYYVGLYFKPYAKRIASLTDMYMGILLPAYIGKSDFSALFTRGTVAYRQNAALDANNDGLVTKAEAAARVTAMRTKGLQSPFVLTGAWQ